MVELDFDKKVAYLWDDIAGCTIFLGPNSPIVIDATEFPKCKENAFSFTDLSISNSVVEFGKGDLGIFNFVDKTISRFYPPEICHSRTADPIWFTPNTW